MNTASLTDNALILGDKRFYSAEVIASAYGVTLPTVITWIDKGLLRSSRLQWRGGGKKKTNKLGRGFHSYQHFVPHEALFDEEGKLVFMPPSLTRYGGVGLFAFEGEDHE